MVNYYILFWLSYEINNCIIADDAEHGDDAACQGSKNVSNIIAGYNMKYLFHGSLPYIFFFCSRVIWACCKWGAKHGHKLQQFSSHSNLY